MHRYELLIAGGLGSIVYALLSKKLCKHKIIYVLCGTITAYYFAPAIAHFYKIESEELKSLIAFISGVAGADLLRVSLQAILQYLPLSIKKKLGVDK